MLFWELTLLNTHHLLLNSRWLWRTNKPLNLAKILLKNYCALKKHLFDFCYFPNFTAKDRTWYSLLLNSRDSVHFDLEILTAFQLKVIQYQSLSKAKTIKCDHRKCSNQQANRNTNQMFNFGQWCCLDWKVMNKKWIFLSSFYWPCLSVKIQRTLAV